MTGKADECQSSDSMESHTSDWDDRADGVGLTGPGEVWSESEVDQRCSEGFMMMYRVSDFR